MASVSVDTGTAIERVTVPLTTAASVLVQVELGFPLGLVLEAGEGAPAVAVVSEVTPGGAADAAQVQVGDVLRAVTAAMMSMTYPPGNLLLGGKGLGFKAAGTCIAMQPRTYAASTAACCRCGPAQAGQGAVPHHGAAVQQVHGCSAQQQRV